MNLILFLYIAAFFTLTLGELGQFPFGNTDFSVAITDVLITLNLTALLIWNISYKKGLKLPKNLLVLIGFWLVGVLSLFFSFELSGWLYLVRFIIYSTTFYITYNLIKSGILSLDEFLSLLKLTSLVLAVMGIFQLIFFPDLEFLTSYGYDPHKNRLVSTFLDPNLLGTFLSFSIILTISELLNKKSTDVKLFISENRINIILLLILFTSVILTFSRSAYLILFTALGIVFLFKNWKLLIGLGVLVAVLFLAFPQFNQRIVGAVNIDKSAQERFFSWDKGMRLFQQSPILGVGFNNIRSASQKLDLVKTFSSDGGNSGSGVDSSLIFVLATTGLAGFLVFVVFLVKVLVDIVSTLAVKFKYFYNLELWPVIVRKPLTRLVELPRLAIWERPKGPSKIKPNFLGLPLLGITLGLIISSFFINSLFFTPIMFLYYSMIGVFYGLGEGVES